MHTKVSTVVAFGKRSGNVSNGDAEEGSRQGRMVGRCVNFVFKLLEYIFTFISVF